jgi:predicted enzyme related to lactoylglutathione lyase
VTFKVSRRCAHSFDRRSYGAEHPAAGARPMDLGEGGHRCQGTSCGHDRDAHRYDQAAGWAARGQSQVEPASTEIRSMKQKANGIGGVFFKAKNPAKLCAWYRKHLGFPIEESWNGCQFHWREEGNPKKAGTTVWSAFKADTKYFGSGRQAHMINYRVANLKKILAQLKREGVWVDPKTLESEFGKFGWIKDGEGNRIELWEPPSRRSRK